MATNRQSGSIVFTGARAIFYLGGTPFAYATDVSGSEEILREEINVLGQLEPVEYAETGYRVTLRCRNFRTIPRDNQPGQGHLKSQGIFPKFHEILTSGELTASIVDKVSNEEIARLTRVKAATRNWTVSARTVFAEDITFNAIRDTSGEI